MKHFGLMSLNGVRAGFGLLALCFVAMAPSAAARPAPNSFADIVEELLPTVVNVSTSSAANRNPLDAEEFQQFRDFMERFGRRVSCSSAKQVARKESIFHLHLSNSPDFMFVSGGGGWVSRTIVFYTSCQEWGPFLGASWKGYMLIGNEDFWFMVSAFGCLVMIGISGPRNTGF